MSGSLEPGRAEQRRRPSRAARPGTAAALVALGVAGMCAFLNLYATQPLLPLFEQIFGVSKAMAAWTVSAPTIAVALGSPFVGALAEKVGRRRLIVISLFALAVPTLLCSTAQTIGQLVAWRFVQGLILPAVYAVALAYIGEAWAGGGIGRAMAALITGNVLGGFSGRFLSGLAAAWAGWRSAFVLLSALTAAGALASALWLPEEQARSASHANPFRALRSLANRLDGPLAATFAVGFNVLFTQVAIFTYVTFHLAGPPYRLGVAQLSSLFVVYLVGAVVTPFAGRWIDRVGSRATLMVALASALAGVVLTLAPALWTVVLGLAICCTAVFVSQSASTSFLQAAAPDQLRSTASGVYVSCYYVGGSVGGVLPAAAWHLAGWPGCVALVAAVQLASLALAVRYWRLRPPARRAFVEAPP
jgi:MFS transporter, YNFM family, putative membrane transport protein